MAKGIRSKAKRQNRSQIRATLSEPIIKKRQEEINNSLQKSLEEQNGSTIQNLKTLFPSGGLGLKSVVVVQPVAETEELPMFKKNKKEEKKVVKGSRARPNPNKQLAWF